VTQIQPPLPLEENRPWYRGISGYQWLVLIVASAGWIFDIYENQIYNITRTQMLASLLHTTTIAPEVKKTGESLLSVLLLGGAVGGVMFGMIADRFGRSRAMILSILMYAIFSAMTAAAQSVWQVGVLRFLVSMGTGGEWAVAAALVSEVFPARARAHASGIFHASSVLGVGAAGLAGMLTGTNWRMAYLLGLLPAVLVFAVRWYIREPRPGQADASTSESAVESSPAQPPVEPRSDTRFSDLWTNPILRRRAILGMMLGAVGLGGYWAVFVAGQDLAREFLLNHGVDAATAAAKSTFAYATVQNFLGGAVGLFLMGPLCGWIGRKPAFVVMQAGAIIATPIACYAPSTYGQLLVLLPIMGFFVGGMHAGYAVYFPELFPMRLRATGSGLCFNGGRLVAATVLYGSGWLKSVMDLRQAVSLLAMIYVIGLIVIFFLPETKAEKTVAVTH
jgi:MFS family permease